jgi:hypothetical protein
LDKMNILSSSASVTASANSASDLNSLIKGKERVNGELAPLLGYKTSWQHASGLEAQPVASSLVATDGLRVVLGSLLVAALLLLLVAAV